MLSVPGYVLGSLAIKEGLEIKIMPSLLYIINQ